MTKIKYFYPIFLCAILLGLSLRFYQIDLRPMHNDEGVNWHFIKAISEKKYYEYSHENYHGPAYFYLTKLCTILVDDDELGMRLSCILIGGLTAFLLLLLRRHIGDYYIIISSFVLALSPSLIFYSRYSIHESLFLFSTLLFAIGSFLFFDQKSRLHLYLAALGLALMICTKETYIIALFSIGLASLLPIYKLWREKQLFSWLSAAKNDFFIASLSAIFIIFLIYSAGFRWIRGIWEMFYAVQQWIGRAEGDTGHFKPFFYYLNVFWKTESFIVIGLLIVLVLLLLFPAKFMEKKVSSELRFSRDWTIFLAIWFLSTFIVYSFIKYKTPWLIINITLPGLLFLSSFLASLMRNYLKISIYVIALTLFSLSYQSYKFNFEIPYGNANPFSYVHTTSGMLEVVDQVNKYWEKNPKARVLVAVPQYWPLPFYFRKKPEQLGYISSDKPQDFTKEYSVIIAKKESTWQDENWARKYYRLSDVQETYTYFKR